jgi:Ser/Thr protein kinase RdoA (MazF antagonist)
VREVGSDGKTTNEYTFKIHNGVESDALTIIEGMNVLGTTLADKGINSSCPHKGLNGEFITWAELPLRDGKMKRHAVRLLAWVSGGCMVSADVNLTLLYKAGQYLGRVRQAMDGVDHPGFHREHFWDINSTSGILQFVHCIQDADARKVVEGVVAEFNAELAPLAKETKETLEDGGACVQLRWGVLMADFNDANIIVNEDATDVSGVIDFGDSLYSCRVYDIAIGVAYAMLGRCDSYFILGRRGGGTEWEYGREGLSRSFFLSPALSLSLPPSLSP